MWRLIVHANKTATIISPNGEEYKYDNHISAQNDYEILSQLNH